MFILLTVRFYCVCASFLFGVEGRLWDLIVFMNEYNLPFYLLLTRFSNEKLWLLKMMNVGGRAAGRLAGRALTFRFRSLTLQPFETF